MRTNGIRKRHQDHVFAEKYQVIKTRKVLNQNMASIQYLIPPYQQGLNSKTPVDA